MSYAYDLLNSLHGVCGSKIEAKHPDMNKHFDTILSRLIRLAVDAAPARIGSVRPIWGDQRLLTLLGRVIQRLTWELPEE